MHFVGLAAFLVAIGVTWTVTPWVIRLARALGAVDLPGGRKIHRDPVPRIGGLAVFAGFFAALVFAAQVTGNLLSMPTVSVYWFGLGWAAMGILIVGLIDDLWGLSFQWKFAAQIVASVFVWFCGFRIELLSHPLGGEIRLGALSLPLTVLWIVGITNAVNLIDGLDGLATGIALITSLSVAVIAYARAELGVTAATVALAGSLVGFLRFNFSPARIFLGDSGSMFLGFVLAVTAVRGSQKGPTAVAILVPLLVLGLPLLDTGLAVVRRLYRLSSHGDGSGARLRYVARNIRHVFLPDRAHIHHRLLDLGLSHRRAVLVLYAAGTLFASSAFALVLFNSAWIAFLLLTFLGGLVAGFYLLLYLRLRSDGSVPAVHSPDRSIEPVAAARPRGEASAR
jgi:UDP-GlcNAc:undecaprenyl-phosphate/decaprenyl-phosphate GlcNAc-1-phosphate transferase